MQGCTELVHVRLQYFREVDEHVRRFLRPEVPSAKGLQHCGRCKLLGRTAFSRAGQSPVCGRRCRGRQRRQYACGAPE